MKDIPLNERLIFALDFAETDVALKWVELLRSRVRFFKVGLQLFLAGGWPLVDRIMDLGCRVMLDLKFFDIPETVHLAVQEVKYSGVSFCTVHGNGPIIEAAVRDKGDLQILAVTVLTSFDESDMHEMGMTGTVRDLVLTRARKSLRLGCDGIVCSPLEARALREDLGDNFLVVTPGIRPGLHRDVEGDDQKRVATARLAMLDGADHLVVGRPISTAENPLATVDEIQREIEEGLRRN